MGKIAAVAVAAALLAACGGGDDDSADGTSTTVSEAPTKAEAAAHLLTVEDFASDDPLDAGWEAGDVVEGVDIQLPDCIDEEALAEPGTATAKFVTISDLHLPSVEQHVTGHTGTGADDAFAAAEERLDGCTPEFVFEGEPAEGTITRYELPAAGDRSAAWRTSVVIAGSEVAVTTVHVVVGDLETAIVHTDIGDTDPAVLAALVQKAVAKLA